MALKKYNKNVVDLFKVIKIMLKINNAVLKKYDHSLRFTLN